MTTMIQLSLWLNVAVLIPVSAALALNRPGATRAFGERSPARGILLSIYLSILLVSAALLFVRDSRATVALLVVQIVYKLTTPFTVGTVKNPVVVSNLAISAFHIGALWVSRAMVLG